MKTIKFRQRILKEDGSFQSFHYWGFIDGEFIAPAFQFGHDSTAEKSDQLTGLLDKNGKEIWEGDIVLANGWKQNLLHDFSSARRYVNSNIKDSYENVSTRSKYIVAWNNHFSQWDFDTTDKSHISCDITEREIEVIGNIYENSDLLK